MSEAAVQQAIRHDAANNGLDLWRNNNGAFQPPNSKRWVRYGICNDSAELNERVKSSDLIGIRPLLITPAWVGYTVGVFTAIETKAPGWSWDEHTKAQQAFHDIVRKDGGFAGFASTVDEFRRIVLLCPR